MKFLLKVLAVTLCLHFFVPLAAADPKISAEKREVISELMEICDAMVNIDQMFDRSMMSYYQELERQNPHIPKRALVILKEEVSVAFHEHHRELRDLQIVLYDRHFTLDELKEMVAFYQTPLGRKITEVTPLFSEETVTAMSAFNERIVQLPPRVQERLRDEGISIPVP